EVELHRAGAAAGPVQAGVDGGRGGAAVVGLALCDPGPGPPGRLGGGGAGGAGRPPARSPSVTLRLTAPGTLASGKPGEAAPARTASSRRAAMAPPPLSMTNRRTVVSPPPTRSRRGGRLRSRSAAGRRRRRPSPARAAYSC